MARTNLPMSDFSAASSIADPAGTAIDQVNGMTVELGSGVLPRLAGPGALVLRVANTAAAPHNVIVRAGPIPPSFRAAEGDLSVSVTNATTRWIGPFEGARHTQGDDSLSVDFDAGFTGTITAFRMPRF